MKKLMLGSAILIELVAIVLIARSIGTDSTPTAGLVLLSVGLVFLVIAIAGGRRSSS